MLLTIVGAICAGFGYVALMVFHHCLWAFLGLFLHTMATVSAVASVHAFILVMPDLDYIASASDLYDPGHWVVVLLLFLGGVLAPISAIVYRLDCFHKWVHVQYKSRIL